MELLQGMGAVVAIPFLGALIGKIADTGGDIIKKLVKDKDLAAQLEHEFRSKISEQDHELKAQVAVIEKDIFESHQKTVQAELQQNDTYTKRARPKIAIRSFYAGLAYVFMSRLPTDGIMFGAYTLMPWQYEWEVLMLLYSPALTYMGVRGFERWKAGGAKV